jgi:ribosomal protein S12 methylthiotransferase accessory factor
LISVPYNYEQEPIVRFPITTGAAFSTSLSGAIYRGICEIVERDAFMIAYLGKLERPGVDLEKSGKKIKELRDLYAKYNLELHIIDITTNLKIPAMLGIIVDKTGLGPAITVGLSADLSPKKAAVKSALEALHSRPWIRRLMLSGNKNTNINTFEGRALYWSKTEMIKKLDFFLKAKHKIILSERERNNFSTSKKLSKMIEMLKQNNLSTYFVDLSDKKLKKYGLCVVKVLIPKLQPLFLNEDFKYLGNSRLLVGSRNLNKIPHPFL